MRYTIIPRIPRALALCALALTSATGLLGCADAEAAGTLVVLLRGESTIDEGLAAGQGREDIVDGWSATFDTWIATVGHVHLSRSDRKAGSREAEAALAVDLRRAPNAGVEVARFAGILAGRWDSFEYETPAASEGAEPHASASDEQMERLIAADASHLIEGSITKDGGQSCPPGGACRDADEIRFSFAVPAETVYGPCSAEDGLSGVVVNAGGTTHVAITLHGDHMFFDRFPVGAEIVRRRAQWLADADVDGDGVVERSELESLEATELFRSSDYSLSGAPIPVETAWDYLVAQLKTSGHFQGEGECPIDGVEHDHDHHHDEQDH